MDSVCSIWLGPFMLVDLLSNQYIARKYVAGSETNAKNNHISLDNIHVT
jgi:hypothetical protein